MASAKTTFKSHRGNAGRTFLAHGTSRLNTPAAGKTPAAAPRHKKRRTKQMGRVTVTIL